jgi:hypothetical protein
MTSRSFSHPQDGPYWTLTENQLEASSHLFIARPLLTGADRGYVQHGGAGGGVNEKTYFSSFANRGRLPDGRANVCCPGAISSPLTCREQGLT